MSARDVLYANLMAVNTTLSPGDPVVINRLLDAYAHELAERQRAWAEAQSGRELRLEPEQLPSVVKAAIGLAADLIDPEVSDG